MKKSPQQPFVRTWKEAHRPAPPLPPEEVWYEAELCCVACGRECGSARLERPDQPIIGQRCAHCGGMPMAREMTQRKRWLYDTAEVIA